MDLAYGPMTQNITVADEQLECAHGPRPALIPTAFARQFPGTFQLLLVVPESPDGLPDYWCEAARFARRLTPVIQTVARCAR